jgi:hypothetical protein
MVEDPMVHWGTRLSDITAIGTERDLCAWLGQAIPGDVRRYHQGALALDLQARGGRLTDDARRELAKLAARARWAAEHSLVHLVQRRFGMDDYDYLVIARHRPRPALIYGRPKDCLNNRILRNECGETS